MPRLLHDGLIHPLVRSLPYGMRRVKILRWPQASATLSNRMRLWFGGTSAAEAESDARPASVGNAAGRLSVLVRRSNLVCRCTLFFDQTRPGFQDRPDLGAGRAEAIE